MEQLQSKVMGSLMELAGKLDEELRKTSEEGKAMVHHRSGSAGNCWEDPW